MISRADKQDRQRRFNVTFGLLALVVILPNVCLLWFVITAFRNERLALRQKWADYYTHKVRSLMSDDQARYWRAAAENYEELVAAPPSLLPQRIESLEDPTFDALVVYDAQGQRLYPTFSPTDPCLPEDEALFREAQLAEHVEKNTILTLEQYQEIAEASPAPAALHEAQIGRIRCLSQLDRGTEAIHLCRKQAYLEHSPPAPHSLHARLLLLDLYHRHGSDTYAQEVMTQIRSALDEKQALNTDTKAFLLGTLCRHVKTAKLQAPFPGEWTQMQRKLASMELSLRAANLLQISF